MGNTMSSEGLRRNLSNLMRDYLWEVIIPLPVGGGDSRTLNLRCTSANIPGRSVGFITIPYKQSAGIKYPGKLTYSHTWECSFIEGEDIAIFSDLYNWLQRLVDDYDNTGADDISVKTDIYLKMLSRDGSNTLTIRLVGCYPESIPDIALSYDTEGNVVLPVTWSFDRWEKY